MSCRPGAAGDDAARDVAHRLAHRRQARLRGSVRVVHPRLPGRQGRLVEGVEEEERLDVRLAEGECEGVVVVRRLRRLVHRLRRGGLGAGVERRLAGRDLALDAELAVHDRQRRAGLRRAVEARQRRRQLAVVGDRDRRRPRMLERRRQARVVLVGVHVERVHDRQRPPGRLVGGDEVVDEGGGGVRVLAGAGLVTAARRQRSADHVARRRHRLDGVVRAREQRFVRGRGGVAAVERELRQPEAVVVRLVADDHVLHGRVAAHDRGRERGEVPLLGVAERRRLVAGVQRSDVHLEAVELRRAGDRREPLLLGGRRCAQPGRPHLVDAHGAESGQLEQVELGLCGRHVVRLHRVLGRADDHRRPAGVRGSGPCGDHDREDEKAPHGGQRSHGYVRTE